MPLLGALIQGLFSALYVFLAGFMGVGVAVRVAAVASFFAIGATLMVLFNGLVAPLVAAMWTTAWGNFLGLAFPAVSGTCMAALASVWAGCSLYAMQRKAISLVAG